MNALRSLFPALLFALSGIAQAPAATAYGVGCHGLDLTSDWPIAGGQWQLATVGVPAVSPFAVHFIGDVPLPGGVPLPALGLPAPGCSAYLGNILTDLSAPNFGGVATATLPIPPAPTLAGAQLSVQSVSLTTANPSLLATSNGLTGTIGANPGYTNLVYNNTNVLVDYGSAAPPQLVRLNGFVAVTATGSPNGNVMATFGDGSTAFVQFTANGVIVTAGTTSVNMASTAPGTVLINGVPSSELAMLNACVGDFLAGGGPGSWSGSSRAMLSLCAIHSTAAMHDNFIAAQVAGAAAPSLWCRGWANVFAVAATVLVGLGCNALAVACAGATVITIGGSSIACGPALAACAAGLFATATGAYQWYIDNIWG